MLAFHQALLELEAEGGVPGRAARYLRNYQALAPGMAAMGFEPYLAPEDRGYIITTYRYPNDPAFHFDEFYTRLSELGFVIYPGKLSQESCFRIGTIGRLDAGDMERLSGAIHAVIQDMASQATASPREF